VRGRRAPRTDTGGAGDLLAGVRAIARDRALAVVTAATSVAQVGAGTLPVVVAVFAERHGDAPAAGWLLTAGAVGGLAGSLVWTWRPAPPRLAAGIVLAGLVATGMPLLLGAATSSILVLGALFVVSGVCNGPLFGALLLVRHQQAPEHLRSQVFALSAGATLTANAAGAALAGLVAGAASSWQLVLAGAPAVLAGTAGTLTLRRRRPARTSTPAHEGADRSPFESTST
jgi:MFS family permease